MKRKNYGALALAAVLLLTAALITSCSEPLIPGGLLTIQKGTPGTVLEEGIPEESLPEGMGYLRLNIVGDVVSGRTVLPTAPSSINHYAVTGTPVDGEDGESFTGSLSNASGEKITVVEGVYTVSVIAYSSSNTDTPVGSGSVTNVNVTNAGGTANINLRGISSGTGTFAWNITLPDDGTGTPALDVDSAELTLASYASGSIGSAVTNLNAVDIIDVDDDTDSDIVVTGTHSTAISSGNYWVTVTLKKAGHADKVYGDLVWIRQNLTTTYTADLSASLAENEYTITYYNWNNANGSNTLTKATHGDTITAGVTTSNVPDDGKIFDAWYKESSFTNKWVFDPDGDDENADRVIGPMTLYGQWVTPVQVTVNVTFNTSDKTISLDGGSSTITFHKSALSGTSTTVTFRLDDPSEQYDTVNWFHGTTPLTDTDNNKLTLVLDMKDNANIGFLVEDPEGYPITVVVTIDGDTVNPYSAEFTLVVEP